MASYNKVLIMGNLTRDPEVRYTPKGTAVCDLAVAVNRVYTTDTGEKREEVTYLDVEVWGRQAENAGQYLAKGRPVFIEGRLRMDSWDDKQTGQKRSKIKIVSDSVTFLGSRGEGGRSEGGESASPATRPSRPAQRGGRQDEGSGGGAHEEILDDDIPF